MVHMEDPDLIHFEQHVNERLGTDSPPLLSEDLLPETAAWRPMTWVRLPLGELEFLSDDANQRSSLTNALDSGDGTAIFPVHPLVEHKYPPSSLVRHGRMAVSSSYRTVFVEAEVGSPLSSLVPAGHVMMIKLHLDDPLPGIAGDRRLTPNKVRKCVELSALLPKLLDVGTSENVTTEILREQFGILHKERGALIRFVPRRGIMPVFSLYSRSAMDSSGPPVMISIFRQYGWSPEMVANRLADWLARPILSTFLAGFRQGFSMEMHGQNTLISLLPGGQITKVYFRDLESVVFFPEIRIQQNLCQIDLAHLGPELFQEPRSPTRWFNRNLDHDIGRIFQWTLRVLEREGVFDRELSRIAARRIQLTARMLIDEFGLNSIARQGRWLPYSRTPYGNGLRRGHYYRTRFR